MADATLTAEEIAAGKSLITTGVLRDEKGQVVWTAALWLYHHRHALLAAAERDHLAKLMETLR